MARCAIGIACHSLVDHGAGWGVLRHATGCTAAKHRCIVVGIGQGQAESGADGAGARHRCILRFDGDCVAALGFVVQHRTGLQVQLARVHLKMSAIGACERYGVGAKRIVRNGNRPHLNAAARVRVLGNLVIGKRAIDANGRGRIVHVAHVQR